MTDDMVHSPETRLIPTGAEGEACFKCGTLRLMAAGIGTFCPNRECDAGECISQEGIDVSRRAMADQQERFRLVRAITRASNRFSLPRLRTIAAGLTTPSDNLGGDAEGVNPK